MAARKKVPLSLIFLILGLIGTGLGIGSGLVLERLFPLLLGEFLPANIELAISPRTLLAMRAMARRLSCSGVSVTVATRLALEETGEQRSPTKAPAIIAPATGQAACGLLPATRSRNL